MRSPLPIVVAVLLLSFVLVSCDGLLNGGPESQTSSITIQNRSGYTIDMHFGTYESLEVQQITASAEAMDDGTDAAVDVPSDSQVNIWYVWFDEIQNTMWYVTLVDGLSTPRNFDFSDGADHELEITDVGYRWDSATYTDTEPVSPDIVSDPVILPALAAITETDEVTLQCATSDADIYYTTNGSTPYDFAGTLYTGPFTLSAGTRTVRARAYKSGMTRSSVTSFTYTVTSTPTANLTAVAGDDSSIVAGTLVSLDAVGTIYDGVATLSYSWALTAKPFGSVASLTTASGSSSSITPDITGRYEIELTVGDGTLSSTDTLSVSVHDGYSTLTYDVIDAEYDEVNDRIIIAAANPNQLVLRNAADGTEYTVALADPPTAISVSPNGNFAAVGHDPTGAWAGSITYVDLTNKTILLYKQLPTNPNTSFDSDRLVYDLALDDSGGVFITMEEDQWTQLVSLDTATEDITYLTGDLIYEQTRLVLSPSGLSLYAMTTTGSPIDVDRYTIVGATAAYLYDSQYHGDYSMGINLWITEDGRLLTGRGSNLFTLDEAAVDNTTDIIYESTLPGSGNIVAADHSVEAGRFGLIYTDVIDTSIEESVHSINSITNNSSRQWRLPQGIHSGTGYATYGRFVFFTSDGTKLLAIIEAESAYPGASKFGVVSYNQSAF